MAAPDRTRASGETHRVGGRGRMVQSAAALYARDGLHGAGLREVAEHAGVPRGSIQHYFPGGKTELATDAMTWMGAVVHDELEHAAHSHEEGTSLPSVASESGAGRALQAFVELWRRGLIDSSMSTGCSIAATVHDSDDPALLDIAAAVFDDWCQCFQRALVDDGHSAGHAAAVATTVVAALEGAVILSRARRELSPLEQTSAILSDLLARPTTGSTLQSGS